MLIYSMSVSVDGFIADREGAFGWTAPSEELFRFHLAEVGELGGYLLGRVIYKRYRRVRDDSDRHLPRRAPPCRGLVLRLLAFIPLLIVVVVLLGVSALTRGSGAVGIAILAAVPIVVVAAIGWLMAWRAGQGRR